MSSDHALTGGQIARFASHRSPVAATPGFLDLPERTVKPRAAGVTHVLDKGLTVVELDGLLGAAGAYVDFIKLGWGTAYVSEDVSAKIAHCRAAGVRVCLGGTLFEIAWANDQIDGYLDWAHGLGVPCLEVSNGSVEMTPAEKRRLIEELSADFEVLAEVGSKRPGPVSVRGWCEEMARDLDAGASWLVTEGRESGTVGLFDEDGEVRVELVEAIAAAVPVDRVIFEAPRRSQQSLLIQIIGPNVGLGNIAPDEALTVETLRRGLRADTIELAIPARAARVPDGSAVDPGVYTTLAPSAASAVAASVTSTTRS
jgi:phosphosulfolactate synthase